MEYSKEIKDLIQKMNKWGKNKVPFLFIIDFEMQKPIVKRLDNLDDEVLFKFRGFKNYRSNRQASPKLQFEKAPVSKAKYSKAFELVMREINYGNSFLLNLAFPTEVSCNLNLKQIFYEAQALNKIYLKDQFVSFSPETFIKIRKGKISSFPMKGTIDADVENAEQILLNDPKEIAEHNTIVDLIRNDLSMVSKK